MMLKTTDFGQPEVVIVDFGISRAMGKLDTGAYGGTPGYIPPETLSMRKWFPGGDVFSLGVVMFQMTTNTTPSFDGVSRRGGLFHEGCLTMDEICEATMNRKPNYQLMPQEFPNLVRITQSFLEKQLRARPRAPKALEDLWFDPAQSNAISAKGVRFDSREPQALTVPRVSDPLESNHPLATCGILPEALESMGQPLRAARTACAFTKPVPVQQVQVRLGQCKYDP